MLIQHEETGRIAEIPDGQPIPARYYRIPEAARVATVEVCQGCEARPSETASGDGVRLCWKCYDAIPADGSND